MLVEYVPWSIIHLGALMLMLLCAAGLGNLFLRRYSFQSVLERLVFTIALGLGLCAIVLFILGLLGILSKTVVWVLTLTGATAFVLKVLHSNRRSLGVRQYKSFFSVTHWQNFFSPRNAIITLLIILAVCYWIVLLIGSQYPPTNWDSISNHLVIARANLTAHRLVIVPGIPIPVLPLLNHMLFTWALALKDDVLAQMLVHTLSMLIALGLYAWGKRQNQSAMGGAAAALWLAHPLIRELGSTAYVDVGLTGFVFLGVYALRVFWDGREARWWYLGMAFFAMAAGSKLTGLFFLGLGSLLGLSILVGQMRLVVPKRSKENLEETSSVRVRFDLKSIVFGGALALLIVMPWYAFSAYHTGNPVWPFFPKWSKEAWSSPWLVDTMSGFVRGTRQATIQKFFTVYIDFFRYPARFNAENNLTLFPLIVLWPLAWVVALFDRSVRWWVFWALAFTLFWFLQVPLIRYWFPALPLAGLALCESIQWILERIRQSVSLHNGVWLTVIFIMIVWGAYDSSKRIYARGLPPATLDAREDFLNRLNGYLGVRYVNEHADKSDTVCVLSASWLNYYFQQRVLDLRGSLYGDRKPTFRWPNDEQWTRWLDSEHVNWIFIYHVAPELDIPKQNPLTNPFWPGYRLVYADSSTWVFRRKGN